MHNMIHSPAPDLVPVHQKTAKSLKSQRYENCPGLQKTSRKATEVV